MTNIILSGGIVLFLLYAVYDQFLMDKLKGQTKLSVKLRHQAIADSIILMALVILTIVYGVQNQIQPLTLFLLAGYILISVYNLFFRSPRLLLKAEGFFFGNVFFKYENIAQINVAEQQKMNKRTKQIEQQKVMVIDLKNKRRLVVQIADENALNNVITFFGGYKF